MGDKTGIAWTEATWNPITGCSIVSSGCSNCYAMREAGGRLRHLPAYEGLTDPSKAGPVWNGKVRLLDERLDQPLRWRRPRRIFVNSMGDLFHEEIPDSYIDKVFAVMALAPQHVFQILTKRAYRMQRYMNDLTVGNKITSDGFNRLVAAVCKIPPPLGVRGLNKWPLPNVWLGVSAEDQTRADERIPHLLNTPAAVRFVSFEPLIGAIRAKDGMYPVGEYGIIDTPAIDWAIIGGESGPRARPMDMAWARDLLKQCQEAGVPAFVKQLGQRLWEPDPDIPGTPTSGTYHRFKHSKGGDMSEWPEDMRVQEYPAC